MRDGTLRLLFAFLLLKAFISTFYIISGTLPLAPDEAQYWLWSRALDFGYYSKPPGVAWQIWLGTELFGHSDLGVRFCAILIATVLPLAVYQLARAAKQSNQVAFWAALCMAFSPLGMLSSIFSTTDGGFILFWTLAATAACRQPNRIYRVASFIALGALFKWPIYLLWLPFLLFYPSKKAPGAIALSLLGLLPSLIWNWSHEWATFKHVGMTVAGRPSESAPFFRGNFFDFIGAQIALLSPLLFFLLILGLYQVFKKRKNLEKELLFCASITGALLGSYALVAIKQKMQGNWAAFAYPTAMVIIAWQAELWRKTLYAGLAIAMILSAAIWSLPALQSNNITILGYRPSYKLNAFQHNLGWNQLPKALEQAGYDPSDHFLFGSDYQTSCEASFYSPKQKRAYFFNILQQRKNQFSYWPTMEEEQIGKSGFYLIADKEPNLTKNRDEIIQRTQLLLSPYFDEVELVDQFPLFLSYGEPKKSLLIFRCRDYQGGSPSDPENY